MNPFALLTPIQLVVFCSSVVLMLFGAIGWVMWVGFRHEPPGFLRRSFFDATGQPNGVLLTVFNAVVMLNALTINFMVTGNSPTVYMWATWGTIVLFGIGADATITRAQINASKPGGFPGSEDCGPGAGPGLPGMPGMGGPTEFISNTIPNGAQPTEPT